MITPPLVIRRRGAKKDCRKFGSLALPERKCCLGSALPQTYEKWVRRRLPCAPSATSTPYLMLTLAIPGWLPGRAGGVPAARGETHIGLKNN